MLWSKRDTLILRVSTGSSTYVLFKKTIRILNLQNTTSHVAYANTRTNNLKVALILKKSL